MSKQDMKAELKKDVEMFKFTSMTAKPIGVDINGNQFLAVDKVDRKLYQKLLALEEQNGKTLDPVYLMQAMDHIIGQPVGTVEALMKGEDVFQFCKYYKMVAGKLSERHEIEKKI